MTPPVASIRTRVRVPITRADGMTAVATLVSFDGLVDGAEHLALALGDDAAAPAAPRRERAGEPPLVRLNSECLTGDVFGNQRCDCGPQLRESLERISASGGYLLYLRQEGRGIGLYPKLDAYSLQDLGLDTYEANVALGYREDERDYTAAAQMLLALGAGAVALLTNNPDKVAQLRDLGIDVVDRVPTAVHRSAANSRYLAAKSQRAAHRPQAGSGSGTELAGSARAPLAPPAHRRTGRAAPGFGGRSPVL